MSNRKTSSVGRRSGMLSPSVMPMDGECVDMVKLGRYCHTDQASEGDIYHEVNITSEDGVVLESCDPRPYHQWMAGEGSVCVGAYEGHLYRTEGKALYYDDVRVEGLELPLAADIQRHFAHFDSYIVIMPDKYYYQPSTGTYGSLETQVSLVGDLSVDTAGVYEIESSWNQTGALTKYFRVGDWVHLNMKYLLENSTMSIVQELYIEVAFVNSRSIGFDRAVFPAIYDARNAKVTITRKMPDLEGMCVCHERLFGYVGNTVYASRRGNLFNWYVMNRAEEDAYRKNTAHDRPFTACTVYRGKPVFFAEDLISTVYGDSPDAFVVVDQPGWGVLSGSSASLVNMGGKLYYLSPHGVTVYDGDEPTVLSDTLGARILSGVAGSDGRAYVLSATVERDGRQEHINYVYNLKTSQWHCEDGLNVTSFVYCDQVLYGLHDMGYGVYRLWMFAGYPDRAIPMEGIGEAPTFCLEFADVTVDTAVHAGCCGRRLKHLLLWLEVGESASVQVYLSCDGAPYRLVKEITDTDKRCVMIPVAPNRCQRYRLRLGGVHWFKLYGIGKVY